MVNYKTNQRPKLEGFDYGDIISAEIVFSKKTIEYFKNGKSILKTKIKFKYPWYFAIWPARKLKCIIEVIQDQNELMELRRKHQNIAKSNAQKVIIDDDSKCNNCDQLKQKMNLLQLQNDKYRQVIIKLKTKNVALNDECKETKLELEELKIKYLELKKKVKLDINDFMNWSGDDVADWIISLDENRFSKYENKLREVLKEQNIDGSCLADIVKSDITEWGIKDFKDKTMIFKQISSNFQNSNAKPNNNDNDMELEGANKTQYI